MQCWECDNPANATCVFCGRFVCKDHAAKRTNVLAMFLANEQTPKLMPVADAIWCGICAPQEPMSMPELY